MAATILLLSLIVLISARRLQDWRTYHAIQQRARSLTLISRQAFVWPQLRHPQQETFISLPPRYVSPEQHRNQLRHASRSYAARRSFEWCSSQSQRT